MSRPRGEGCCSHTAWTAGRPAVERQASTAFSMAGGATLPQRNTSPRSTITVRPTNEVSNMMTMKNVSMISIL